MQYYVPSNNEGCRNIFCNRLLLISACFGVISKPIVFLPSLALIAHSVPLPAKGTNTRSFFLERVYIKSLANISGFTVGWSYSEGLNLTFKISVLLVTFSNGLRSSSYSLRRYSYSLLSFNHTCNFWYISFVNIAGSDLSKLKQVDDKNLEKEIKTIIDKNKGAPFGALMGMVMAKFKGKVDGKKVSEILKKLC